MTFTAFLPTMPLQEPILVAMRDMLQANLPATITTANSAITDGYPVPNPAQYLDFMPVEADLALGLPIVAVGESPGGGRFVDDQVSFVDSEWEYAILVVCQSADHETMAKNLRRLLSCVAYTIQADRLLGNTSYMRNTGGVFSVNLRRVEPGPLLGEPDPLDANVVRSWLSWATLIVESRHNEKTN